MFVRFTLCIFLLMYLMGMQQAAAQCGITVDAGPDQTVCAPSGTVTLNGTAFGPDIIDIQWSPVIGLSSPNTAVTDATVSTTTTYTLMVSTFDANNNIIVDGDFSSGSINFTSDYVQGTGGTFGLLSFEGTYAINTNSSNVHTNFANCTDHTGGGNMMIVNGATTPDEPVWCQTVTVMPQTDYVFSAWLMSVIAENPAILQFTINGISLGTPFNASPSVCQWNEFNELWNSGSATSAEICITNQNTQPSGNDFALDDIFFGPVCKQTDDVTVEVIDIDAFANPIEFLPCVPPTTGIPLDGSISSSGPNITYQWTGPSNGIVSGETDAIAFVNMAGIYTLTVTFDDGNITCTDQISVTVLNDLDVPFAFAFVDEQLDCNNNTVTVFGSGSSTGSNITYQWATFDGNIISPDNMIDVTVDQAGTYTLLVTNTTNGCTAEADAQVFEDFSTPDVVINPSGNIDCDNTILTLDGTGSSSGSVFSYLWTTSDGNILGGATTLFPDVDQGGTYTLTVTNVNNGCTNDASIVITEDTTPPTVLINPAGTLDCQNTSLTLDASGSSTGTEFNYLWTTTDGNIASNETTLMPVIDAPGTYILTIENTDNGCENMASIIVSGDGDLPTAVADVSGTLDCQNSVVSLIGTESSTGINFTYQWATTDGNITGDPTSLNPEVDQPGTYTLTVINTDNGCTASDDVQVIVDGDLPNVMANVNGILDCQNGTVTVDASESDTGMNFSYSWTTMSGNIIAGNDEFTATVDASGDYVLTVTNGDNGCTAQDTVTVGQATGAPFVEIAVPDTLNCIVESLILNAENSDSGSNFLIEWNTTDGNIVNGNNSLSPEIDAPGTYTLEITNTDNGCSTTGSVTVVEDVVIPTVDPGLSVEINCNNPTVLLDGSNSSQGNEFSYQWSTTDGNILNGATDIIAEADAAGQYNLSITNTQNGCTANADVLVEIDTIAPATVINFNGEIDCDNPTLQLMGMDANGGSNLNYEWTTSDGNFTSATDLENAIVDASGTYFLQITNTENGCAASASVFVDANENLPNVGILGIDTLTCTTPIITLSSEFTDPNYLYEWTTTDGNILTDPTAIAIDIDAAGYYRLIITDTQNNCSDFLVFLIIQEDELPIADAGVDEELTCGITSLIIGGTNTSAGSEFTYQWTTMDGNYTGNTTNSTTTIDDAGTYTITVTNTLTGCTSSDEVIISESNDIPMVSIEPDSTLTCVVEQIYLSATASVDPAITYVWTTVDGSIVDGANGLTPLIDAPGSYTLTVLNAANNCSNTESITIFNDTTIPTANAGMDDILNCTTTSLLLDGSGSDSGADFQLTWMTADGNFVSGANSPTPEIDAAGTYNLTITNLINGCTNTDAVVVDQDTIAPVLVIDLPDTITCQQPFVHLDGSGSSTGTEFIYNWTSAAGNDITNADTPVGSVGDSGDYELTITNTENGCTASDDITVFENTEFPIIEIVSVDTLNCLFNTAFIDASGSSQGSQFEYDWQTVDGNIVGGSSTNTLQVNEPGFYILSVTDNTNSCTSEQFVEVIEDLDAPSIDILPPSDLTCKDSIITLDATGSDNGANFSIEWSGIGIIGGENTLEPTINTPGIYTLNLTNTSNFCEASANVTVTIDTLAPIVSAGATTALDCIDNTALLDGSFQNATNIAFLWTTTNGNILSDQNTNNLLVDQAGNYLLTVTNLDNGCIGFDGVEVLDAPVLNLTTSIENATCATLSGQIAVTDIEGGTPPYIYSIENDLFQVDSVFNSLSPGTYDLTVQDADGCETTESYNIFPPEDILLEVGKDTQILLGTEVLIDPQIIIGNQTIDTLIWSPLTALECPLCPEIIVAPMQTTTYELTLLTEDGCEIKDALTISIRREVDVFFPNVFSPNNDGINDTFYPQSRGNAVANIPIFQIYDRWGNAVFELNNFQPNSSSSGWDGTYRNHPMDNAVFVYFAEIEYIDGRKEIIKGDVTLVR